MNHIKQSLLPLFQTLWAHRNNPPQQIQDMELDIATALFHTQGKEKLGVVYQLLSHKNLHRYIMVVLCPDQAFYPDAIRSYLQKRSIVPTQVHSVLFSRDEQQAAQPPQVSRENELFILFHFSAVTTDHIQRIEKDIQHILQGVYASVSAYPDMLGTLTNIATCLAKDKPDSAELLRWMLDDHYLLFGLLYPDKPSLNKGICRDQALLSYLVPSSLEDLKAIPSPKQPDMQWLHLTSTFAHIYSHTNVRALQISWIENQSFNMVILVGHFSRGARYTNASLLPQLNQVWQEISLDLSLQQSSFYRREIRMLFDRAPKSLLHSIPPKQWLAPFKAIVDMHSPTQVVVERLQPKQGNFDYLLIAVSSHRFGDNVWQHMQHQLGALGIHIWGYEGYDVGATHLIFVAASAEAWPHHQRIHQAIRSCIIFWKDKARQALLAYNLSSKLLPQALLELSQVSQLYQNQFEPEQFVSDIILRDQVNQTGQSKVRLKLLFDSGQPMLEIQILTKQVMPLASMTEKLNAFALVTMEQALVPLAYEDTSIHIYRFRCEAPSQLHQEGLHRLAEGVEDVFNQVADHDPLNALIILGGLHIQDVLILIALRNHLAQLMPNVSVGALSSVMIKQKKATLAIFRLFEGKHRPTMPSTQVAQASSHFQKAMLDVQNLKEDTWLRALFSMVQASVRTNAWVRERGQAIAIKVDTSAIDFAPYPRPYREIFVHGVNVEGVHLRAGKIARGGLRYSDRPTDFRTEVLELMATQVVKNGQIVPTGAKGGFVIRDTSDVLGQYRQFIHALLSITDNRIKGKLVPPQGVRIAKQDEDDAYLVVAADKGTARYSDDANAEALAANFWLGDAFASGGSYGYDHKAFGITAKGAWVCTAHLFSHLGVDLYQDEVTVVAIGGMSGDVFGNGMLLNPNLKLVAAFNHKHIFLDPNPDVKVAFAERQRLFQAVKSWESYDVTMISEGGGIFDRGAKRIQLSKAVRHVLGIEQDHLSGEALIRAILQAPVDLLYNGGIGTYVKASHESDADAQDPANNPVRVNADSLRCKVVSEGGNLGFTQAARIEYAGRGGMINTDAIDNAAGVNMSDHEVNLKILLADIAFEKRNAWLLQVADDVAKQCLQDNKEQAIALSLAQHIAQQHVSRLQHLQQTLLEEGYIQSIQKDTQTLALRPVLAEWLGHEKNRVHHALDATHFHEYSLFADIFLEQYFPDKLRKPFITQIRAHALASDIAHTRMTSYIINHMGLTSVHYLQNLTSAKIDKVVQALLVADVLLDAGRAYKAVLKQRNSDMGQWYARQQDILYCAEGLLVVPGLMDVDKAWLQATRKHLHAYAKQQQQDIWEVVPLITAIALATQTEKPLKACLRATQQCLEVIPFVQLEAALHTPLWSGEEAHALRKEWLGRIMQIKIHAAKQLLLANAKQKAAILQQWQHHPLQQTLTVLSGPQKDSAGVEEQRLAYILALTHLQSIVECACHLH